VKTIKFLLVMGIATLFLYGLFILLNWDTNRIPVILERINRSLSVPGHGH